MNLYFGMVTNSNSVGGFNNMIGKTWCFDDGEFEATLIKLPKNPLELTGDYFAIASEQQDSKYMYSFKTKEVTFRIF